MPAPPGPPPGEDADEEERGPLRRCLVTRERLPKEAMIRFVLAPDRTLVPDLEGRLPGRGMWLSARRDVLERASLRGAFARAARGPVQVPPDLRARIEDGLRRRIRDLLGLARRAGQAVCGFQKAQEWLKGGRAALVVQAADGSPAERRRLAGGRGVAAVAPLSAAELGAVFGRDQAVHVAVAPGRLAQAIKAEAERLAGIAADGMRQAASPPGAARDDEGEAEGRLAGGTDGTGTGSDRRTDERP
ncbi:RNA-binding protein [Caldovatus aquaticus]|uniref:RNA-binding protein n=1 Tax=Caldovatus aquaticus TaxID=2865671 RepID=A0ABS7F756_9PROT|nr:RNA-binding protein [Caldovatus aquaticus]